MSILDRTFELVSRIDKHDFAETSIATKVVNIMSENVSKVLRLVDTDCPWRTPVERISQDNGEFSRLR